MSTACWNIGSAPGSRDRTIEIARSYGARVFEHPWQNDFSLHRNRTIDHATGHWLLFLDADDVVEETDADELIQHLTHDRLPDILMVRHRLQYPHGREIVVYAPRIIRKDSGIRYQYPIHEQLDVEDGDAMLSNVHIRHRGYVDHDAMNHKDARNLEIAREMGDVPHALHTVARAALTMGEWDQVVGAADRLIELDAPSLLRKEAAVLAGTAAFNKRDSDALNRFLDHARSIDPNDLDVRFLEMMAAFKRYTDALEAEGGNDGQREFLRTWMLWHDPKLIQHVLDLLTGKKVFQSDEIPTQTETDRR